MVEPKPIASLGPRLLARKGGARPAMRSQASVLASTHAEEDLGWNDMGHDFADGADVVPIGPDATCVPHVPEVIRQQRRVASQLDSERQAALPHGRRAAFTLRLDAERHLQLRLACTIRNRSAQQLVTDALDAWLRDLPDLADLAARVAKKRN